MGVVDADVMLPVGHAWGDPVQIEVFSGCVGVLDVNAAATIWEDLVYDGPQHQHGVGMSWLPGGFVVRVPFDGLTTGRLLRPAGQPGAAPVGAWLQVGSPDEHEHEHDPPEGHSHRPVTDGWTNIFEVPVNGNVGAFGDPSAGPWAYDAAETIRLAWPASHGVIQGRVHMMNGAATHLLTWWASRPVPL